MVFVNITHAWGNAIIPEINNCILNGTHCICSHFFKKLNPTNSELLAIVYKTPYNFFKITDLHLTFRMVCEQEILKYIKNNVPDVLLFHGILAVSNCNRYMRFSLVLKIFFNFKTTSVTFCIFICTTCLNKLIN